MRAPPAAPGRKEFRVAKRRKIEEEKEKRSSS
jgi:hypothetical protein